MFKRKIETHIYYTTISITILFQKHLEKWE